MFGRRVSEGVGGVRPVGAGKQAEPFKSSSNPVPKIVVQAFSALFWLAAPSRIDLGWWSGGGGLEARRDWRAL